MSKAIYVLFAAILVLHHGQGQTIVGYWPLNETSGSVVADNSGFGNSGTAGGTTITPGVAGNGRQFPSTTAAGITVPHSAMLNISGQGAAGAVTLEAFLKISDYDQTGVIVVSHPGQYALSLGSFANAGYLQFQLNVGSTVIGLQSDTQVPKNQWLHIAGSWDGTTAKLYMDYVLLKSATASGSVPSVTAPVQLASFGTTVAPTSQAWVDEIRITRGVLPPSSLVHTGGTAGPVGWWGLNESTGTAVLDVSGYGNHGTTGATTVATGYTGNGRLFPASTAAGITVPHNQTLNIAGAGPSGALTLEAHLKITDYDQTGVIVISHPGQYGLMLGSFANAGYLQFQVQVGSVLIGLQSDAQVPKNQWLHIAGSWDGSTARLFLNHQEVKTTSASGSVPSVTAPIQVASFGTALSPTSQVWIDDIRISRGALIPAQLLPVDINMQTAPAKFSLAQNYPNPFNPSTTMQFDLPVQAIVRIGVFTLLGERVALLADGPYSAGHHTERFDASGLASGVYFYRLEARPAGANPATIEPAAEGSPAFVQTRRMVIVR